MARFQQIRSSLFVIDAKSETGRNVLIRFLEQADAMVRCEAAKALYPTHRDLAVPVLQDISLTCVTEACDTASMFLIFSKEPNKDSDLTAKLHAHKYDETLYQEALERFANNRSI